MKIAAVSIILAAILCIPLPAFAVYKCESGGRIAYSDLPCEGGKLIDIKPANSEDASVAELQTLQEKKKLKRLERERHSREAADERDRNKAARKYAARQKKCATLARNLKWANEDVASSTRLRNERAKRKARRLAEVYEAECGRWPERELTVLR